jgi:ABC-type uncharacterized transport system auxiliary subunit
VGRRRPTLTKERRDGRTKMQKAFEKERTISNRQESIEIRKSPQWTRRLGNLLQRRLLQRRVRSGTSKKQSGRAGRAGEPVPVDERLQVRIQEQPTPNNDDATGSRHKNN